MRRFGVIANPVAGKGQVGKMINDLRHITDGMSDRFDIYPTKKPGHATSLANQIYPEYDAIIAIGGDGTANEVMNGLAGTDTPFGLIPEGSGNDFARTIYMPSQLETAVNIIARFKTRKIDLGTINDRIFLNGIGIGFDGYVNLKKHDYKSLKGPLSYFIPLLVGLFTWKPITIQVEIDGNIFHTDLSFLLAIGNGWACGGGLKLNPDADIHDGIFDVCHISDVSALKVIANLKRLKDGSINDLKEVSLNRGKKIKITSDQPIPAHFDGEILSDGCLDINIEVVPSAATVIGGWT